MGVKWSECKWRGVGEISGMFYYVGFNCVVLIQWFPLVFFLICWVGIGGIRIKEVGVIGGKESGGAWDIGG